MNVSLGSISKVYVQNQIVSPSTLFKKGLITKISGKLPAIKILATGVLDKPLIFVNCQASQKTKEQIEKNGGKIK